MDAKPADTTESAQPSANGQPAGPSSDTSPAVPPDVIYKLLFFTVVMISSPLIVYFLSRDKLFDGNTTFAGVAAVVTVNLVLFTYIFVAWIDDRAIQKEKKAARLKKKNT